MPAAKLRPRALIVHPRRHVADVLSTILGPMRIECDHAEDEAAVVRRVGQPFSLMLNVIDPSDPEALHLLAYTRRKQPWLPVVVLSTAPDAGRAREALRLGALAVLEYPCPPVKLREVVSDALRATAPPFPAAEPLGCGGAWAPGEALLAGYHVESRPGPLKKDLEAYERVLIWRALQAFGGNREKTAAALGINRTTLYYKMKKYHFG